MIDPFPPQSSHTRDLKIGTLIATLPSAYCASTVAGWAGVRIL